jgi:putative membrane protein insertion efficiency factor
VNRLLIACILAYRAGISSFMPAVCRFTPSCSEYAIEALRVLPLWRAVAVIGKRIGRCHPWGGSGFDPVCSRENMKSEGKAG